MNAKESMTCKELLPRVVETPYLQLNTIDLASRRLRKQRTQQGGSNPASPERLSDRNVLQAEVVKCRLNDALLSSDLVRKKVPYDVTFPFGD